MVSPLLGRFLVSFNLQSVICGLRSAVCGLRSAVCGLRSAVCGLRSAVCVLRSAVCSLQSANVIHQYWLLFQNNVRKYVFVLQIDRMLLSMFCTWSVTSCRKCHSGLSSSQYKISEHYQVNGPGSKCTLWGFFGRNLKSASSAPCGSLSAELWRLKISSFHWMRMGSKGHLVIKKL